MEKFDLKFKIVKMEHSFDQRLFLYTDIRGKRYVMTKVEFTEHVPGSDVPNTGAFIVDELMLRGMHKEVEDAIGAPYNEQEAAAKAGESPAPAAEPAAHELSLKVAEIRADLDNLKRTVAELIEVVNAMKAEEKPKRTRIPKPKAEPEPAPSSASESAAPSEQEAAPEAGMASNPWS